MRKAYEEKLQEAVFSFTFMATNRETVARLWLEPLESRSHPHTLSVKPL
jgi:hypothetical protein